MSHRVAFRQADLVRALKAAGKVGFKVRHFEVHPDGTIVVHVGEPEPVQRDYLAEWQADRARQKALSQPTGWEDVVDGTWRANTVGPPVAPRKRGRPQKTS